GRGRREGTRTHETEGRRDEDVVQAVVDAVRPDAAEEQDRREADGTGCASALVLADLLVDRIGGELRDRWAAARQDAEQRTDDAAAQRAGDDPLELRPRRTEVDLAVERRALVAVVEILCDFRNAEATERHADEPDTVGQERPAEGEALGHAVDVGADRAEEDADQAHGKTVEQAAGRHEAYADALTLSPYWAP